MKRLVIFFTFLFFSFSLYAQDKQVKNEFNLENGVAVKGYDVVAYVMQNKAVKVEAALVVLHRGVTKVFSYAAKNEVFQKNPSKLELKYGGWSTYAMASTHLSVLVGHGFMGGILIFYFTILGFVVKESGGQLLIYALFIFFSFTDILVTYKNRIFHLSSLLKLSS